MTFQDGTYFLIEQPVCVGKCILHSSRNQSKRLTNVIISLLSTPIPFLFFFPYICHLQIVHLKLQLHRVTQKGLTFSMNCKTVPQNHTKQCLSFISAKSQTDFRSASKLCLFPKKHIDCVFFLRILKHFIGTSCCFPASL